jgi:hypothetical protein
LASVPQNFASLLIFFALLGCASGTNLADQDSIDPALGPNPVVESLAELAPTPTQSALDPYGFYSRESRRMASIAQKRAKMWAYLVGAPSLLLYGDARPDAVILNQAELELAPSNYPVSGPYWLDLYRYMLGEKLLIKMYGWKESRSQCFDGYIATLEGRGELDPADLKPSPSAPRDFAFYFKMPPSSCETFQFAKEYYTPKLKVECLDDFAKIKSVGSLITWQDFKSDSQLAQHGRWYCTELALGHAKQWTKEEADKVTALLKRYPNLQSRIEAFASQDANWTMLAVAQIQARAPLHSSEAPAVDKTTLRNEAY